jgi:hypothetical protein
MVTRLATFVFLYSSIRSSAWRWSECRPKHVGDNYVKKYCMTTEVHLLVIYIFWDQTDARKMERVKTVHSCCAFRGTVHTYTQHTVQSAQVFLHFNLRSLSALVHDHLQTVRTKLRRINKHTTLHILNRTSTRIPQFFTKHNITVNF